MSISRRTIITHGTLLGLSLGVPMLGLSFGSAPQGAPGLVYDRRFAAARRFAEVAAQSALWVASYDGDLTQVWRERLRPHWAAAGGPVAGISTERGLLCVALLAREHHHRVVARRPLADSMIPLFQWLVTDRGASVEEL